MIEYVGETCSDKEIQGDCSQKYTDGTTYLYSILVQNEEHMNAIDATCYGNASSFINCCCKPDFGPAKVLIDSQNLSLQHLALFAIEPIASGEELAFNCNACVMFVWKREEKQIKIIKFIFKTYLLLKSCLVLLVVDLVVNQYRLTIVKLSKTHLFL